MSTVTFRRAGNGHFEANYVTPEDMLSSAREELVAALEQELSTRPLSVLFVVGAATVPRAVPEFWLGVTTRLAPRLCAMAIVSPSLAVRSSVIAFSVANRVRGVKLAVKAFSPAELEAARQWCAAQRLAAAPGR
ncbi:MAG: STAS/SEC14 domain-containing protein [Archangium sp.]|nr:STAS/SEC14 domain-containing protein [Archangium sp.]